MLLWPLAAAGQGRARQIEPYVLLLVDLSSSMRDAPCVQRRRIPPWDEELDEMDVSAECACSSSSDCLPGCDAPCTQDETTASCGPPCNVQGCGDGFPNDSRLWKVKVGMSNAISAFGEITFGLARFPRQTRRGGSFRCPGGGWCTGTAGACAVCGPTPGVGANGADILVGLREDNQDDLLDWMDGCDDWPASGPSSYWTPEGGPVNCGAPDAPTSGCNLCADPGASCAGPCDKELRATSDTPIAGGLLHARQYFSDVVRPDDAVAGCRPYRTLLLSDGAESCSDDFPPYPPHQQAAALCDAGVGLDVIGFEGSDDRGDWSLFCRLKNIARAGCGMVCLDPDPDDCVGDCDAPWDLPAEGSPCGCSADPDPVMVADETRLALAIGDLVAGTLLSEVCDGEDNDCDGEIDEDFPVGEACDNGLLGECFAAGEFRCAAGGAAVECDAEGADPSAEVCDGLDNDCNGAADEIGCVPCLPQAEVCNGIDDDCDGDTDEGFVPAPCGSDVGACTAGTSECRDGRVVCEDEVGPVREDCNCVDDNCDGVIDGLWRGCYPFARGCDLPGGPCRGRCRLGVELCPAADDPADCAGWQPCQGALGPEEEVCNGIDDDCDGDTDEGACAVCREEVCDGADNDCDAAIDEDVPGMDEACGSDRGECAPGVRACIDGREACLGEVPPAPEACNGLDDDCDGDLDEDAAGMGQPCGSDVGACEPGAFACEDGRPVCAGGVPPAPEVCNGVDDDCDGETDETFPQRGTPCGSSRGQCRSGVTVCRGGALACDGATPPALEVCDGLDNNCDGSIDEGVVGAGGPCGEQAGACEPGVRQCIGGEYVCLGEVGPSEEACNGRDDDCDGTVDEDAPCPEGECIDGYCALPCSDAEFPCAGRQVCVACGLRSGCCVPDACAEADCPPTDRCELGEDRRPVCVPLCRDVQCDAHEACERGVCRDDSCVTRGCPAGSVCRAWECEPNPCWGVQCGPDRFCREGECYPVCAGVACPAGQSCRDGGCAADACAGVACGIGQVCHDGDCLPDPCIAAACPPGEACRDGDCVPDPCLTIACPPGTLCAGDQCADDGRPGPRRVRVIAGGGCARGCAAAPGAPGGAWALAAALAAAAARRRRR